MAASEPTAWLSTYLHLSLIHISTAKVIAKMAHGLAEDMLTNTVVVSISSAMPWAILAMTLAVEMCIRDR